MKKRSSHSILVFLVACAILALVMSFSANFKADLLFEQPSSLASIKLVRENTDPVQFAIFDDQLKGIAPANVTIVFVNALVERSGRFEKASNPIDKIVLATGDQQIGSDSATQSLVITNLKTQITTKLGTIITNIAANQYVSLEYDVLVNGARTTLVDRPPPMGFPVGYSSFTNPLNDLLYIATPSFHTILGPEEKAFLSFPIHHGAPLLANTLTTLQSLDSLTRQSLIAEPIRNDVPKIVVEQHHLVLPRLDQGNFNALVLRYRFGNDPWNYSKIFLPSEKNITLPVPVQSLLDFYSEVEYSFVYVSQAISTVNQDFPFNSLLPKDQFPVFYRTPYASLVPELVTDRDALTFTLPITATPQDNAIGIGFLSRDQLFTLSDVVDRLSQSLTVAIVSGTSTNLKTFITKPDQLPYFTLIGKNDQLWTVQEKRSSLPPVPADLKFITFPSSKDSSSLRVVNASKGDRLLCFLSTVQGDTSLTVPSSDLLSSSDCLASARRSGATEGVITTATYRAGEDILEGLDRFSFDASLSSKDPLIKGIDAQKKLILLLDSLNQEKVSLLVSPTASFDAFQQVSSDRSGQNAIKIPLLATCDPLCFVKVATILRDQAPVLLATLSDTAMLAKSPAPALELCFSNISQVEKLFDPADLKFQVIGIGDKPITMNFQSVAKCYETLLTDQKDLKPLLQKKITFHTNGLALSHVTIPPENYSLTITDGTNVQMLLALLAFEHVRLIDASTHNAPTIFQKSYQQSSVAKSVTILPQILGTIVMHQKGNIPYVLSSQSADAPLNETNLFPGSPFTLSVPSTIRVMAPDQVFTSGFDDALGVVKIALPLPAGSSASLSLSSLFRSPRDIRTSLRDGIVFDSATKSITLKSISGSISIPLEFSTRMPTDTSLYAKTVPETPLPSDLDLFSDHIPLVLSVDSNASQVGDAQTPIRLPLVAAGSSYQTPVTFPGVFSLSKVDVKGQRFFPDECAKYLSLNASKLIVTGTISSTTKLQGCFLDLQIAASITTAVGKADVSSNLRYVIPFQSSFDPLTGQKKSLKISIPTGKKGLSLSVKLDDALEEVFETGADFLPLQGALAGQFSSVSGIAMALSADKSSLSLSGDATSFVLPATKYFRAVVSASGALSFVQIDLVPVSALESSVNVVKGFSNIIDLKKILQEKQFTDSEIASVVVVTNALTVAAQISNDKVMTINASAELDTQFFSLLIPKTPSAVSQEVKVTFHLTPPTSVQLPGISFSTGKQIILDLLSYTAPGHTVLTDQLPDFLKRSGTQLTGKTPDTPASLTLVIQDATTFTNLTLPLQIKEPTTSDQKQVTIDQKPAAVTSTFTKPAADVPSSTLNPQPSTLDVPCFTDIAALTTDLQKLICSAKGKGFVSGGGGLFRPSDFINRAEISKLLVTGPLRSAGLVTSGDLAHLNDQFAKQTFRDVPRLSWFYGFVQTLYETNVMSGYPDGAFHPDFQLNRAEAAKILSQVLIETSSATQEDLKAFQKPQDPWYGSYVRFVNSHGGSLPDPSNAAKMSAPISRLEFLVNLMQLISPSGQSQ